MASYYEIELLERPPKSNVLISVRDLHFVYELIKKECLEDLDLRDVIRNVSNEDPFDALGNLDMSRCDHGILFQVGVDIMKRRHQFELYAKEDIIQQMRADLLRLSIENKVLQDEKKRTRVVEDHTQAVKRVKLEDVNDIRQSSQKTLDTICDLYKIREGSDLSNDLEDWYRHLFQTISKKFVAAE